MRKCVIFLLLIFLSVNAFADLEISVEPDRRWGNAPVSNIKRLCENVALHFQEQLRDEHKVNGDLSVVYYAHGPIAFYRSYFGGAPDEYRVGLKVTGTYWSKFSYQFGHEFCHVMQNHDKTRNYINRWFEEAICELANVWVLRRMSETWAYRPPYRNWVDYRHHLANYADNLLNDPEAEYSGTGAEWLEEWEDRIRRDEPGAFTFERVTQLSYKFLPIFEETPEAWNAVRQMPISTGKMSVYMQDWYDAVDPEDQPFVASIAEEMGISVETEMLVIDADVNNDGYVDLSDVLIVRRAMTHESAYDTDINNDGVTNILDLLIVKAKAFEAIAAAAPRKKRVNITTWGSLKRR